MSDTKVEVKHTFHLPDPAKAAVEERAMDDEIRRVENYQKSEVGRVWLLAVEALLQAEWTTDGFTVVCPACGTRGDLARQHEQNCTSDTALKANGFPDQESRVKEREKIHARQLKEMAEGGEK